MESRVGWDLELLQKKEESGDSVEVTKKTTGANGEAVKDSKGVGRVEGTSKYGKLHYRVTPSSSHPHHHHHS